MENMNVGDILIYIAAIMVAVSTIYNCLSNIGIFAKNKVSKAQKKKVETVLDEQLEERVVAIMSAKLPAMLDKHDEVAHEKFKQEVEDEVMSEVQFELGVLDELKDSVNQLALSAKDVLREKIMGLYHKNKDDRTLSENEKEALEVYYHDYKAIKGNNYIDKYYRRMSHWEVIPDGYEEGYYDDHSDEHDEH